MPDFLSWNEGAIPLAGMVTGLLITPSIVKAISRPLTQERNRRQLDQGNRES